MTDEPVVELLWESGEPHAVMYERFGFVDSAAAASWVRETVATAWGIDVTSVDRLVMSDHNALAWVDGPDEHGLLVKWSVDARRHDRLETVARLVSDLGDQGLPVSAPVPALDGRPQVRISGASVGLQRLVAGELLDTDDPVLVEQAGAVLARFHLAMDGHGWPGDARMVSAERVTDWLAIDRPHLPHRCAEALRGQVERLATGQLPVQLVHGDYRAANVLCSASDVVAVIDFEEAHLGCALEEAARSAVLLGTRYHDWSPVAPEVRATFRAGYVAVRPLGPGEHAWWDTLELWHALAMVPHGDDPTGWGAAAEGLLGARPG